MYADARLKALESGLVNVFPSKAGAIHDAFKGVSQALDTAAKNYGGLLSQKRLFTLARREVATEA